VLSRGAALLISYGLNANTYAVALGTYMLYRVNDLSINTFLAVFAFLAVLPLAPIFIDYFRGKTDIFVSEKVDRPKYFTLASITYLLGYIYYRFVDINSLMAFFLLTYFTVTASMTLVSFRWKASVHACGVSGPTTFMVVALGIAYLVLYLLLIPVYLSRSVLRAHTKLELVLGMAIGFIVTLLTYLVVTIYPQLI